MTVPPLFLHVNGRDLRSRNPESWRTVVSQVGGAVLAIAGSWRWITVSRPGTLTQQRGRVQTDLDLATLPLDRERLQATALHLRDLEAQGIRDVQHYLIIWPISAEARAILPRSLAAALGGVTVLDTWPTTLLGSATYTAVPQALVASDTSHVWSGMLSQSLTGRIDPRFFWGVLTQPFSTIVMLDIQTFDRPTARQMLDGARPKLEAHAVLNPAYNEERRAAFRDWGVASELVQDGSLLHTVQIGVWVNGTTVAAAMRHQTTVSHLLAGSLALRPSTGRQQTVIRYLTPTRTAECGMKGYQSTQATNHVAVLVPGYLTSDVQADGVLMGRDVARGVPLFRALERLGSAHGFIAGGTGSGKSSYVGTLLYRLITERGLQGIVLDPQGAFAPLAAVVPGVSYNRVSLQPVAGHPPLRINVLDVIVPSLADDAALAQQVLHVEQLLTWRNGSALSIAQGHDLRIALTTLYSGLRHATDLDDPATSPLLSDLVAVLAMQDAEDRSGIGSLLRPLTQAPFASLYNQPTTLDVRLDPRTPLIVYDLSDPTLPETVKQFMMLLLTGAIQRAVRTQPRECVIVMDEAGILFRTPLLAQFASTLAKTVRRFRGRIWVIDQTLALLDTPDGAEVFENSAITVLGMLKSDQKPALHRRFPMLTEAQIDWICGLSLTDDERAARVGHYILIVDNVAYQIANVLSAFEWQLLPQHAVAAATLKGF